MFNLKQKEEKAKKCVYYKNGFCRLDGYPPFDCEYCSTFKKKENDNEGKQN